MLELQLKPKLEPKGLSVAARAIEPRTVGRADGPEGASAPGRIRFGQVAGTLCLAAVIGAGAVLFRPGPKPLLLVAADIEKIPSMRPPGEVVYALTFYDTHDEDGDVVEVSITGAKPRRVVLTNAGTRLPIPMNAGRLPRMVVTAVRDGARVNRVSVGVKGAGGVWASRVLAEGGSQEVPLKFGR